VVLKAMCERIGQLRGQGAAADFILLTGDLAFSGKPEEYALADGFLDELVEASGVPNERIFCIPGNHYINR
jgi:3',5'-cyclic AMP phosphodiesterase CpdA